MFDPIKAASIKISCKHVNPVRFNKDMLTDNWETDYSNWGKMKMSVGVVLLLAKEWSDLAVN